MTGNTVSGPDNWAALLAQASKDVVKPATPPASRVTLRREVPDLIPSPSANDESQDYYARLVASELNGRFAYASEVGWLAWNEHRWDESTGEHVEAIRDALRAMLPDVITANGKHRKHFSAAYVRGIESLCQTDARLRVRLTEFDTDAYALNTPAGVVDLYTGEVHPPDSRVLVRKSTAVAPDFDMPTPLWDQMLSQIFAGDADTSEYVMRALGLSLIGAQDHQVFFMLNGVGGSGKGTTMSIAQSVLGTDEHGYSISVEASMFTASRDEGHPTQIARMHGKRMVVSSEITEAVALDTAKLKNLTGGDKLTGHFMRKDYFTFDATHTLWIMTNYRPRVSVDDSGFWRRLREIPFLHKPATVIEGLADKIVEQEGPGVLAKMIVAARDYLNEGLTVPQSVIDACQANRSEQDTTVRFIEECCETDEGAFVTFRALHDAYGAWCKRNEYKALGDRAFGKALNDLNYRPAKGTDNVSIRRGLQLNMTEARGW